MGSVVSRLASLLDSSSYSACFDNVIWCTQTITMTIKQKNNLDTNLWHEPERPTVLCRKGRSPKWKWIDHVCGDGDQRRCTFVQIEVTDLFDWNRTTDLLSSRTDATGPVDDVPRTNDHLDFKMKIRNEKNLLGVLWWSARARSSSVHECRWRLFLALNLFGKLINMTDFFFSLLLLVRCAMSKTNDENVMLAIGQQCSGAVTKMVKEN